MTKRQKDSEWFSTPETRRRRKSIELTLADETLERLDRMAKARKTSRSAVIDQLVKDAPIRPAV